jgi:uncharacterized protein (TIGR02147 family)
VRNKQATKVNLFEYQDYRAYLRDWFDNEKTTKPGYSFRVFAKKAGFQSSNFLMLIMQDKRNLTEESLKKCVTGLGLNLQEQEFFRNLVFFNQAHTHEDKNFYYLRLLQSKKFGERKSIERQQYEYYSTWYHPAVRELVMAPDFDGTPEWIAHKLFPAITPAQVVKSMELLEELGFIIKGENGRFTQSSAIISTGPELTSVVVHNYHKVILDLSKAVMDRLSMTDRDVSSLTLGVKRSRVPELRQKIREFRKDILKLVSEDTAPEDVVLLNIQFYPVTKQPDAQTKKEGTTS